MNFTLSPTSRAHMMNGALARGLVPGLTAAKSRRCSPYCHRLGVRSTWGAGRLTRALAQRGPTIGVDTSAAMLTQARQKASAMLVQADAFRLAFADASFDVLAALRVVFHIKDLDSLFSEVARVLAPGGTAVFDTYLWSPWTFRPFDPERWGRGIYIHAPHKLESAAHEFDLQVAGRVYCFLFSPYVYRRLRIRIVKILARVEPRVPPRLRPRVFWKLVRV